MTRQQDKTRQDKTRKGSKTQHNIMQHKQDKQGQGKRFDIKTRMTKKTIQKTSQD